MMNIYFSTRKLARACNSREEGIKRWGQIKAQKVFQRLSEIKAADNLAQLFKIPAARCHQLKGKRKGQFAVDAKHPFRVIFKPDNNPVPCKEDGGIDIEQVTAILVLEVRDYHD